MQSTNCQASNHDEPHAENVSIPKQAPGEKKSPDPKERERINLN